MSKRLNLKKKLHRILSQHYYTYRYNNLTVVNLILQLLATELMKGHRFDKELIFVIARGKWKIQFIRVDAMSTAKDVGVEDENMAKKIEWWLGD